MRRISVLAALAAAVVALSSCASTQSVNPDNSLLVMMIDRESVSKSDLFVKYKMKGEGFELKVDPLKKFQQYNMMAPGLYTVKSIQSIYIQSGQVSKSWNYGNAFSLEPNTVTIFPGKFVMDLTKGSDGRSWQSWKVQMLTLAEIKEIEEYIASQPRYAGLAIRK